MMSALLAVEGAIDALDHANIATEILGFTTARFWKGGKSSPSHVQMGPAGLTNPGRLCDLRHLIYGVADRKVFCESCGTCEMALLPYMLHRRILIGEALEWAASRLNSG